MQNKQRFVADQRVDLPHVERMLSLIEQEFGSYNHAFSATNVIFQNWKIEDNGGLSVRINNTQDSLLFDTEKVGKESAIFRAAGQPYLTHTLANNAVNYVELQIQSLETGPQIVSLWDDNAKAEYAQVVNTCYHEEPVLVSNTIGFTSDPDKLSLAIVTTVGGVITVISDQRDSAFHLATDWNFGISRTDFGIGSVKDAYDALATSIKEIKGATNWYDAPYASLRHLKQFQNYYFTGGGLIKFEGSLGANQFGWDVDILIEIAGRPAPYPLTATTLTILEGECVYVDVPETLAGPLAPQTALLTAVNLQGNFGRQVLFYRKNNIVYGIMDIPETSSGGITAIGQPIVAWPDFFINVPADFSAALALFPNGGVVCVRKNITLPAGTYTVPDGLIITGKGMKFVTITMAAGAEIVLGKDSELRDLVITSASAGVLVDMTGPRSKLDKIRFNVNNLVATTCVRVDGFANRIFTCAFVGVVGGSAVGIDYFGGAGNKDADCSFE